MLKCIKIRVFQHPFEETKKESDFTLISKTKLNKAILHY